MILLESQKIVKGFAMIFYEFPLDSEGILDRSLLDSCKILPSGRRPGPGQARGRARAGPGPRGPRLGPSLAGPAAAWYLVYLGISLYILDICLVDF